MDRPPLASLSELAVGVGEREVVLPAGQTITIGRDPGSTVILEDPRVSRRHAEVRPGGRGWELVDLGSRNGTWLRGRRVERVVVDSRTEVQMGAVDGITVVLTPRASAPAPVAQATTARRGDETEVLDVADAAAAGAGADAAAAAAGAGVGAVAGAGAGAALVQCSLCGTTSSEGTEWCRCGAYLPHTGQRIQQEARSAVSLTLAQTEVAVAPGGTSTSELRLRNAGGIVDSFSLRLGGDAASWSVVEPATVNLFPGTTGTARVVFRPPREPSVRAGRGVFTVTAKSRSDDRVEASQEGLLTVEPFREITARIVPETARAPEQSTHRVVVDNRGNAPTRLAIVARDPDDVLSFAVGTPTLLVSPGSSEQSELTVRSRLSTPSAPEHRRFRVEVLDGEEPVATLDAALVQGPDEHETHGEPTPVPVPTPAPSPTPPPEPRRPEAPGWRPEVHPLALLGGLTLAIASVLAWVGGESAFGVPVGFLVGSSESGGLALGPLVALGGLGAAALSLLPSTAGLRRLVGLAAIAVAAAVALQVADQEGVTSARDALEVIDPGVFAAAVGGFLIVISR